MINLQNIPALLFILALPLLYLLRKAGILKINSLPAVLRDWEGEGFEWKHKSNKILSFIAKIFYVLAYIALCISLADPVKVKKEKIYNSTGTELIFVLDTSPSMAAKDMEGLTRLDSAKDAITSIMETEEGFGFGLVEVGSEAALAIPPTVNHQYFYSRLEKITAGNMGDGSAIGDGLSTAVYHLTASSAEKKCIILLTDGENNAGKIHPETAARLAAEYNIKLYVVGIGTKGTIPIEYTDPKTGKTKSGYLESNYNSSALRKIAMTGGGRYFEVRTLEELKFSLDSVASQEAGNQTFTYRNSERPLYKYFTLSAILLFLAAVFIRLILLKGILLLRLPLKYKRRFLYRAACLISAFLCALLALSGLSWGTYLAPVQKNSTSVAMVFDISYSMMAKDCPEKMTRLQTAALYAKELLSRMEGTSTSVILAKGDGMEIIPMTQDKEAILSLMEVISPALMTVPGSSIGKGILKARQSIPDNFSSAGRIWVFTDGEETDGNLSPALGECIKDGIPVCIIGFGQENESAVLAGDGITSVKTALRSEEIYSVIRNAEEKYKIFGKRASINYIQYSEKGSAIKLLNQLKADDSGNMLTSYEVRPVPRYKFFLFIALVFAILSFISGEGKVPRKLFISAIFTALTCLSGCSSETFSVLKGTYAYHQENYRSAVAEFKNTVENARNSEDQMILDYALYNLGTTYAAMEEGKSAANYFSAISEEAPDKLKFAAYYNAGVMAHKNGDFEKARENFRRALEIDSHNIEAKINMELSIQIAEDSARQNQTSSVQGKQEREEHPDMDNSVFEHIKENDQKQWKNSEQTSSLNSADDY